MCRAVAWARSQVAMRQPLARSVPVGKVPARVGNRSQARPREWSLVGFQVWGSQQLTAADRLVGAGGAESGEDLVEGVAHGGGEAAVAAGVGLGAAGAGGSGVGRRVGQAADRRRVLRGWVMWSRTACTEAM